MIKYKIIALYPLSVSTYPSSITCWDISDKWIASVQKVLAKNVHSKEVETTFKWEPNSLLSLNISLEKKYMNVNAIHYWYLFF